LSFAARKTNSSPQEQQDAAAESSTSSSPASQHLTEAVNKSVIPKAQQQMFVQQQQQKQRPPPPTAEKPFVPPTSHASRLKQSDSSFGLHSPDNFPSGLNPQEGQVQVRNAGTAFSVGLLGWNSLNS
jgi:hypothetical protein